MPAEYNMADLIRTARRSRSMTQKDLAEKIGVTQQAVQLWESGKTTPGADKISDLADELRIPIARLLNSFQPDQREEVILVPLYSSEKEYSEAEAKDSAEFEADTRQKIAALNAKYPPRTHIWIIGQEYQNKLQMLISSYEISARLRPSIYKHYREKRLPQVEMSESEFRFWKSWKEAYPEAKVSEFLPLLRGVSEREMRKRPNRSS